MERALTRKSQVLIVDDSQELRLLIKMALESSDYELLEAANAIEGLMMINRHRPKVVLLDVMMPGRMDGLGLCQKIKQDPVLKTTYVIMVSARGQQDDIQRATANGADDYVVKPFSPMELIQKLNARS
jgi:CheY-like chemotaxis protein